jgi:hypothetical protein
VRIHGTEAFAGVLVWDLVHMTASELYLKSPRCMYVGGLRRRQIS